MAIKEIIIRGVTADGRRFRPSDWCERLYYAVGRYGPNRQVTFNPLVKIKVNGDMKCVVVDSRLQEEDPMIFNFLIGFARDNDLVMIDQDDNPVTEAGH
ncbi:MAG: hypothetical protein NFCOHLIN_02593 [Gammaproteobacteria bacterium]|nr:hypothetical protein [Gammaproteobacteria bacterium]